MRTSLLLALSWTLISCTADGPSTPPQEAATGPNKWADVRLWKVLEAQDHRDAEAICGFLSDSSAGVREAAALAFASFGDSVAGFCLLRALGDAEPRVRKAVAVSIGNTADSVMLAALAKASDVERDTSVVRVMLEVLFHADVQRKHNNDPDRLWQLLGSGNRNVRLRAAQALARHPKEKVEGMEQRVLQAARTERDPEVRMFLTGTLKHYRSKAVTDLLMERAAKDSLPQLRVSAIRALAARQDNEISSFFLDRMNDGVQSVRFAAVEALQRLEGPLDADEIWKIAQVQGDAFTQLPLYGLVLKHGTGGTRLIARKLLEAQAALDNMEYAEAAILRAQANDSLPIAWPLLDEGMKQGHPMVLRTTALELALALPGMKPEEGQKPGATYVELLHSAIRSGDPGMIAMAVDELANSEWAPQFTADFLVPLNELSSSLDLPRDFETWLAVNKALARLKGAPEPAHATPGWNHPIDRERLKALKDGQEYRLTTNKGEIVLALEVDAAPGSCVAFDSLVTSGYYSGRYFHRVIPNFVAQGGCPRGDGWGGMDWTLRTEIGYEGFTTGAVGLASAGPDTESCQFFIMLAPAPHLDGQYTRFAHVVSGMDVVERLQVGDMMISIVRQ